MTEDLEVVDPCAVVEDTPVKGFKSDTDVTVNTTGAVTLNVKPVLKL